MLNKCGWVKDVCVSCKIKMFKKCRETNNLRLSLENRDCIDCFSQDYIVTITFVSKQSVCGICAPISPTPLPHISLDRPFKITIFDP